MKTTPLAARLLSFSLVLAALGACTRKAEEGAPATAATPAGGKKTLNFAISDDVKSGDPANYNDVISAEVMGHIYEGLLGFKYLGKMGDVEPVLAEALPVFSDKNKTVTIKIRPGIFFQDDPAFPNGTGREVTADDFVFSFKRIADAAGTSTNWWMFDGMVVGLSEWRQAIADAKSEARSALFDKPVDGLQAPDAHTLVIKLTKPYPQLLPILAMNGTVVMAREVVQKHGADVINHPVGTGAYRLKEWIRGSKIIVEKNPKYREAFYPGEGSSDDRAAGLLEAAGRKIPFVDEIQWDVVKEEQPRWLLFRSGQLAETGIPKDNFKEAIGADGQLSSELAAQGIKLHKAMSITSWWLEFNLKDPVVGKNKNLRRAIAHAFDRAKGLDLLYNNRGMLASGPVPPSIEGGTADGTAAYPYDVEAAKRALVDAGFPGGKGAPELTLDLRGPGQTHRQFGELLQANLAAIGLKLNILANSFPEALEKAKTSRFQMMLSGWAGDYPDPENFLALWYGPNAAPGNNSANLKNKDFDKLYEQVRSSLPGPEREKAVQKAVAILNSEITSVFFFHSMDYRLARGWLKNYHPHLLLYGMGKYLDVDTVAKAAKK